MGISSCEMRKARERGGKKLPRPCMETKRRREREKMGIIISRAKRRKKESVEAAKKARKKEGWVRQKGVQK